MQSINWEDKTVGRLRVVKRVESDKRGQSRWLCRCLCGNKKIIYGYNLHNEHTKSCGCITKEKAIMWAKERFVTHGSTGTNLYKVWLGMRCRCYQKTASGYERYGGRGIEISDSWQIFDNFKKDMEAGFFKGLTLDRINNDGNYCKENCRWATRSEQTNNCRNKKYIILSEKIDEIGRMLGGWNGQLQKQNSPSRPGEK